MNSKQLKNFSIGFFLLTSLVVLFFTKPVFAVTDQSVTVVPSQLRLDLRTQPSTASLYYKNNTADTVEIDLSAVDFSEANDSGQVQFLTPTDSTSYQYGMASWITFDTPVFFLNPGEQKTITVSIQKEKLAQGGHYASVLAQIKPKASNQKIQIKGYLSSLLFVRAGHGFTREEAVINQFSPDTTVPYFPESFALRIQNTGNIDITPYGLITITDIFGHRVAKGTLNEGSFTILPDSLRRFSIPIRQEQLFLWPEVYHATLSMHYGEQNKKLSQTITFFSQGTIDFVKIITVLIILWLIFFLYKQWKKPFKI